MKLSAFALISLIIAAAFITQCTGGEGPAPVTPPVVLAKIPVAGVDTTGASLVDDGSGHVWIVDAPDYAIHRVDIASGVMTNFPLSQNAEAHGAVFEDGALWVADYSDGQLLRYDESGAMRAYPVGSGIHPYGLAWGDGRFWFVEQTSQSIGAMAEDGTTSSVPIPMPSWLGGPMARGGDGTLWVGGPPGSGTIGRRAGLFSFQLFAVQGQLGRLFACPDGTAAFESVEGEGAPWTERIGIIDARGRERSSEWVAPSPPPARTASRFVVHSSIVGPPPPPNFEFFACDAGGAWFVIDRATIGHVTPDGELALYDPAALASPSPAGTASVRQTAWVAIGDSIVKLGF